MKPDPVPTYVFSIRSHGDFLSTREFGKTVLRALEDQTPPGTTTVIIDFTDVVAMTHSFTDELLGQHYSALATHDGTPATVMLTGLTNETRETIVVCLERRDLIALELHGRDVALLAASEVLTQTFALAKRLKVFTAVNIAEGLNITAPNANNRLKRLVAARALIRQQRVAERGGKEFTYMVPSI